jgi:uncharacterized protein (TIGR01777 family)
MLKSTLPPFKAGVGGRLGSGNQWMSWIHLDDIAGMIVFAMQEARVNGPVNGVGPQPVRNSEFTLALAHALHRPAVFPVPLFALKLRFGEMADVILQSQRVLPDVAMSAGFRYRYPSLIEALAGSMIQA